MRILDIDLDVFVKPKIINRSEDGTRPADNDCVIPSEDDVRSLVTEKWLINSAVPIQCIERHVEVVERVENLIGTGELVPPLKWIHIDAHDDFYGFHSRAVSSENFMFEIVRRDWCEVICWVYPDGELEFPSAILDQDKSEVYFDGYRIPMLFLPLSEFRLGVSPDYAFLTRSPEFSPAKADSLYEVIAECGMPK